MIDYTTVVADLRRQLTEKDRELHTFDWKIELCDSRIRELESQLAAKDAEIERLKEITALKTKAIVNLKKRLLNVRKDARDYRKSKSLDDYLKAREGVRALQTILAEQDKKVSDIEQQLAAKDAMLAAAEKEAAQSTNYICDNDSFPQQVWFANGRTVKVAGDTSYLQVEMEIHPSLIREPNGEELAALEMLRKSNFIERLVGGEFDEKPKPPAG